MAHHYTKLTCRPTDKLCVELYTCLQYNVNYNCREPWPVFYILCIVFYIVLHFCLWRIKLLIYTVSEK